MNKIPTLFVRDEETNRRYVRDEVSPGCEWVIAGEGRATRKYDGTCVLIRRDGMAVLAYARHQIKEGAAAPDNFVEVEFDPETGKTVGWIPAAQSSFAKFINEAITPEMEPGTYELCGPRINKNPEGYGQHFLIPHAWADQFPEDPPRDFVGLAAFLPTLPWEGLVWHHPDGRMAKIKRKDFPRPAL